MTLLTRDSYYYGCIGDSGHYLWTEDLFRMRGFETMQALPWGYGIDAELCPKGGQVEGLAALHHKNGWTALAFWDRTVDTRPGSNSVFVFRGTLTFDEAVAQAKARFPTVWQRFTFAVWEGT